MNSELPPLVEAAQRVAGVIAARSRGDREGAATLMSSFADERELAAGALLVAELGVGLLHRETGQSVEDCLRGLCVDLERALA